MTDDEAFWFAPDLIVLCDRLRSDGRSLAATALAESGRVGVAGPLWPLVSALVSWNLPDGAALKSSPGPVGVSGQGWGLAASAVTHSVVER